MTTNQVRIRFLSNLEAQQLSVRLEGTRRGRPFAKQDVSLAVPSELTTQLAQWHTHYRQLGETMRIKNIQAQVLGTIQQRKEQCQKTSQVLRSHFLDWLNSSEFCALGDELRDEFPKDEPVQVFLQSDDPRLDDLPWHEWDFLVRRTQAAYVLSPPAFRKVVSPHPHPQQRQRILVILGKSDGINTQRDADLFQGLPGDPIVNVLPQKSSKDLLDTLWEKPWDVIVFAGHSETRPKDGKGIIHLNDAESLTIDELWLALRKAVDRGLKLVIFNSCDGLGIARQLDDDLTIPQVVVMKELVPDTVAHDFLSYLLHALTQENLPLHLAIREAQQRLKHQEKDYPCASWLPVLWQNPAAEPFVWQSPKPEISPPRPSLPHFTWQRLLATSLAVTCLVMGIRCLGWLQAAELAAYNRLMSLRPAESVDPRITVVGITPDDLNQYDSDGYPLDDGILAQALNRVHEAKPAVVGVGIHRGKPRGSSRQSFIDVFNKHDNTIGLCKYPSASKQKRLKDENAPPELSKEQLENQIGFSDLQREPDNQHSTRRYQLDYSSAKVLSSTHGCPSQFSFGFLLASSYLHTMKVGQFTLTPDRSTWQYKAPEQVVVFKRAVRGFGGYQQGVRNTTSVLINYRQHQSSAEPPFVMVTLGEVLQGTVEARLLKDRVILIGYVGGADREPKHRTPNGEVDAVLIHAHAVSHLLSAALDQRPQIWGLPSWQRWQWGDFLYVWPWAVVGGLLVWRVAGARWIGVGIATSSITLYWICQLLMNHGGWLPLIPSAVSLLATALVVAYTTQQRFVKP
jgi:CHASE2 domain-containing sensor protein